MSSFSGYVTYIEYLAGKDKGQTQNGDLFNSPFGLGTLDVNGNPKAFDADYTGDRVVETITTDTAGASIVLAWTPAVKGKFVDPSDDSVKDVKLLKANGTEQFYNIGADGKTVTATLAAGDRLVYFYEK